MNAELDEQPLLPKKKSTFSKHGRNGSTHDYFRTLKNIRIPKNNLRSQSCIKLTILTIGLYLLLLLSIYLQDLPKFGGSNRRCKRFHYTAPESSKSNATYPFPNTFNVGKTLNFSRANTRTAWQNTQTLGYHNSYHKLNKPGDLTFWTSWWMVFPLFPWAKAMRYEHPPLENQLESGFRTFELDIHMKPDGNVNYHAQMWDQNTHCYCLTECLQIFARFSEENPKHSPITIIIEPKTTPLIDDSYPVFEEITLENILSIEQELLNVFGSNKIITPDHIRLENKTLGESIKIRGWPSVYDLQGSFLFMFWDQGKRGMREIYETGTHHLQGRLIFTSLYLEDYDNERLNDHIFVHADDPLENQELARLAIANNYMLRVRGAQIFEDFEDDVERLEKIRELGQQVVSGDQYLEQIWEEVVKDCEVFDDLEGRVCIRK